MGILGLKMPKKPLKMRYFSPKNALENSPSPPPTFPLERPFPLRFSPIRGILHFVIISKNNLKITQKTIDNFYFLCYIRAHAFFYMRVILFCKKLAK
jgi:hypothetical protein